MQPPIKNSKTFDLTKTHAPKQSYTFPKRSRERRANTPVSTRSMYYDGFKICEKDCEAGSGYILETFLPHFFVLSCSCSSFPSRDTWFIRWSDLSRTRWKLPLLLSITYFHFILMSRFLIRSIFYTCIRPLDNGEFDTPQKIRTNEAMVSNIPFLQNK